MPHFTQSLKKELSFYDFEPVNLITGSVLYEGMDFSFPGALPLEWKRVYHSDSNFKGALGIGVHSLADMRLFLLMTPLNMELMVYTKIQHHLPLMLLMKPNMEHLNLVALKVANKCLIHG